MNEPEKFLYVTLHKPVDEYDISQHSSDEVSNTPEFPDSSLDAGNECKAIENSNLADVNDTDVVDTLDATSRENEFKDEPVTDEEWDGTGLPSVGTYCEWMEYPDQTTKRWHCVVVAAIHDGAYWLCGEEKYFMDTNPSSGDFRIPPSAAQIAEEERKALSAEIYEMFLEKCQATDEVINHRLLAKFVADWHIKQGYKHD